MGCHMGLQGTHRAGPEAEGGRTGGESLLVVSPGRRGEAG